MKSFILIILLHAFVFTQGDGENPETNLASPPNTTQPTPSLDLLGQMVQSLTPPPEMPKTVMPIPPINGTEIAGTMATEETTTVNTTGAMPTEPMNLSYFIIGPPVPPVQEVINTNTPHPPTTPTTETTPTTPTAEITPTTPTTPTTETTTNTPTKETTPTTATLPTPSPAPQPPIIGGASTATFTWTVMVISLTMVLSAFCF